MEASRVAEWKQRKASHAPDPLAALGRGGEAQPEPEAAAGRCYMARVGRVVVARSANVQHANRRVYFPAEDCVQSVFLPSPKRWR